MKYDVRVLVRKLAYPHDTETRFFIVEVDIPEQVNSAAIAMARKDTDVIVMRVVRKTRMSWGR
jgi:hypothetical protein